MGVPFVVLDDVGMVEFSEDVDFRDELLFLPFAHVAVVDFLTGVHFGVGVPFDFMDKSKGALTDGLDNFETVHPRILNFSGR